MKSDDGIGWVIKSYLKPSKYDPKKRNINPAKNISKKLRYCMYCEKSWEIGFGCVIHSYDHLPTYGLLRKKCKICKNKKGD